MLPYTPLHHLLFAAGAPDVLVMTSANRSSEPIAYEDDDARERLAGLADAFSRRASGRSPGGWTTRSCGAGRSAPMILRRGRGYAPGAVATLPVSRPVLALGADLKNTVTLVVDGQAFVSQHIGDLEHYDACRAFEETIDDLLGHVRRASRTSCWWRTTRIPSTARPRSRRPSASPQVQAVQHHRAHVASVLAERGAWEQRVLGISLDGTGYGDDGTIWGGELFVGSVADGFERVAHLRPAALAGGDAAARHPVQAAGGLPRTARRPPGPHARRRSTSPRATSRHAGCCRRGTRVFTTTSAGRLFDAAAALLGFTRPVTFEGQAAMWLEQLAPRRHIRWSPMPFLWTAPHSTGARCCARWWTTAARAGSLRDRARVPRRTGPRAPRRRRDALPARRGSTPSPRRAASSRTACCSRMWRACSSGRGSRCGSTTSSRRTTAASAWARPPWPRSGHARALDRDEPGGPGPGGGGPARGTRVRRAPPDRSARRAWCPRRCRASYEMASFETPLEGSRLVIEEVPVVVFCPRCEVRAPARAACSRSAARSAVRRRRRWSTAGSWSWSPWRSNNEPRAPSRRSAEEHPQAERPRGTRAAAAVPRRGRVRGQPGLEPGRRQDDVAGADADAAPPALPRRRAGRRSGHRERRRAAGAERGTGPPDHDGHGLPSRSRDGAGGAGRLGAGGARLSVHRERRQSGLPRFLRPGREHCGSWSLSVTEGEDKPLKYPTIFNTADVALITKIDMAEAVGFDWEAALGNLQSVRPGMRALGVSAKTGAGMDEYVALLEAGLLAARGTAVAGAP